MNHKGRHPGVGRPSDSLRPERAKLIRVADIAELIVASGQMPAHKGRTYDCTVPRSSVLTKRLANRAVPHMSQSPFSAPIWGPGSMLIDRRTRRARSRLCNDDP
jgi:hypothetical protein